MQREAESSFGNEKICYTYGFEESSTLTIASYPFSFSETTKYFSLKIISRFKIYPVTIVYPIILLALKSFTSNITTP